MQCCPNNPSSLPPLPLSSLYYLFVTYDENRTTICFSLLCLLPATCSSLRQQPPMLHLNTHEGLKNNNCLSAAHTHTKHKQTLLKLCYTAAAVHFRYLRVVSVLAVLPHTGILSEIGSKLRDWAVWEARAGCYSQAALSTNYSKTLLILLQSTCTS